MAVSKGEKKGTPTSSTARAELSTTGLTVEGLTGVTEVVVVRADGSKEPTGVLVFPRGSRVYTTCLKRKKELLARPEEIVRQAVLLKLHKELSYSLEQLDVEVGITMGSAVHDKPADVVVYEDESQSTEKIIVETKRPKRSDGIEQLKSYMNATGAPFGWWTNWLDSAFLLRTDPNIFSLSLTRVPAQGEGLEDVDQPLTKGQLTPVKNLLERLEYCEQEILSHQTVDTFNELFKLVYAKLYDEKNLPNEASVPKFRMGLTEEKTKVVARIKQLFADANKKWKGVFASGDEVELTDDNVIFVVANLQTYRLAGHESGDVLGLAFESMVNKEMKGEKGQFFTPRPVVQMCVTMLNPKENEKVFDPACGSGGFLIYAMKHVNEWINANWEDPDDAADHRKDYAQDNVLGFDNDQRLVKVAKAYMIIENDGRSNIHKVDSLDRGSWPAEVQKKIGDVQVIMTNPPFAGEIKVPKTLSQFELSWRGKPPKKGKMAKEMSRAILFLEACLKALQPGGRLAIVLPQGLLNNLQDEYVRTYIDRECKIIAVVGLHENTFKPFTNTKTSVLFLKKWNEGAAPTTDDEWQALDYPIFTAVSARPGKDKRGVPVFKADGTIDSDLPEVAQSFVDWARDQGLDFIDNA